MVLLTNVMFEGPVRLPGIGNDRQGFQKAAKVIGGLLERFLRPVALQRFIQQRSLTLGQLRRSRLHAFFHPGAP